jgi:hypothetical protein
VPAVELDWKTLSAVASTRLVTPCLCSKLDVRVASSLAERNGSLRLHVHAVVEGVPGLRAPQKELGSTPPPRA